MYDAGCKQQKKDEEEVCKYSRDRVREEGGEARYGLGSLGGWETFGVEKDFEGGGYGLFVG